LKQDKFFLVSVVFEKEFLRIIIICDYSVILKTNQMKKLKLFLAVVLFTFPGMPLLAENSVTLFFGNDSGQMQFAIGEIQSALNEKGQESVVRPVSEINQLKDDEHNIVLLNIGDKANLQLLSDLKINNIEELESEGFIIYQSEGKSKTIWIAGKDNAGLMYGGLEVAGIIRIQGIDALKNQH
jgi:hypothetical protein